VPSAEAARRFGYSPGAFRVLWRCPSSTRNRWVDGYFEENALRSIQEGDPAKIWLLDYGKVLQGHVDSVARGIVVSNATPGKSGLANVNPVFTWVRLAQRIPVRIRIDEVPPDVRLVVGMTATIEVEPPSGKVAVGDRRDSR
jgi:multidrug resistance efflux pump